MGVVISLDEHRAGRAAERAPQALAAGVHAELYFDLGDPFSYLAAERVERSFDAVTWTPVAGAALGAGAGANRAAAEARAARLRMPLVWPERHPEPVPRAMRAAALAAECGRGAAFALAAGRLAFCGGFDLDDPEILAEAAAAAGLGLDACLSAAGDRTRDAAMARTAARLAARGADRLPVLRTQTALYAGEERIVEAVAAARFAAAAHV